MELRAQEPFSLTRRLSHPSWSGRENMTGTRSKVVIAGAAALEMNMARLRYAVPVLLLGLAACGSSPARATLPRAPRSRSIFRGIFAAAYPSDPGPGSSCAQIERGTWQLSAGTGTASLTFANTLPGYEPAGALAQGQTWLCVGQWSITVPSSATGWIFTLNSSDGQLLIAHGACLLQRDQHRAGRRRWEQWRGPGAEQ